jgi:hypothetical protein
MKSRDAASVHSVPAKRTSKPAETDPLSLHPLSVEDALRGAMATGGPPEMPKRERPAAKRAPAKRRQQKSEKEG